MKCKEPTKKYPNGRTGTATGHAAHRNAGEESCTECYEAKREADRAWREKNRERKRENDKRHYKENAEKIKKRSRDWHNENKEKANEYSRKWREENPERFRESVKRWHDNNRDYVKEQQAEIREKNRERMREYCRRYYRENKGKWEGYSRSRRALRRGLPRENYSPEDITSAHGTECRLCRSEVDLSLPARRSNSPHADHVHPLSREGCPGDVVSNVMWTHALCNIKKGDLMDEEITFEILPPTGMEWGVVQY